MEDFNPNTAPLHNPSFRYVYSFLLVMSVVFLRLFIPSGALCVNIVVLCHAALSFFLFHWMRGAPEAAGRFDTTPDVEALTFWEQIDGGYLGTPVRRFLSAVPVALFFVALLFNGDDLTALAVNGVATMFCLVPKHEGLFGVRLWGINKLE